MIRPILISLLRAAAYSYVGSLFVKGQLSQRRLMRIGSGIAALVGASLIGALGIGMLALTLFFQLSDSGQFVYPALITGVIILLVAGLIVVEAVRLIKA